MSLKIVFMGTPEFSIPTLRTLKNFKYNIVCVYTQPAKKKSRGQKILKTPIHTFSEREGIKVKTTNLKERSAYKEFINLKPDLVVVVAYGQIIPDLYLNTPNLLFLNVHASLLPKWRGAAPIERAIINGDNQTGISIMKIEKKLDSGPIIKQVKVKIDKETTSEELTKKLADIGATALKDSIDLITSKKIVFTKQEEAKASYAKKIEKYETKIIWKDTAEKVILKINAFNSKPGAWLSINNERFKILKAKEVEKKGKEGEILDENFTIGCAKNAIQILRLQKEGKNPTNISEFLAGNKIQKGTQLN